MCTAARDVFGSRFITLATEPLWGFGFLFSILFVSIKLSVTVSFVMVVLVEVNASGRLTFAEHP